MRRGLSDIAAVGTTFNIFSYDAVLTNTKPLQFPDEDADERIGRHSFIIELRRYWKKKTESQIKIEIRDSD